MIGAKYGDIKVDLEMVRRYMLLSFQLFLWQTRQPLWVQFVEYEEVCTHYPSWED